MLIQRTTLKSEAAKDVKRLTNTQESGGTIGRSNTSSRSLNRSKHGMERTVTRNVETKNSQQFVALYWI